MVDIPTVGINRLLALWAGVLVGIAAANGDTCSSLKATVEGEDFPFGDVIIILSITMAVAIILGALAAWKSDKVEEALSGCFAAFGRAAGTHPWKFIGLAFFLIAVFSSGFALQEEEVDPAVLWVPTGSTSLDHRDYVTDYWPSNGVPNFLMTLPRGHVGDNVLTQGVLSAMISDWQKLMAIEVDGDKIVSLNKKEDFGDYEGLYGGKWTYEGNATNNQQNLCFKFNGEECGVTSILKLWNFDKAVIDNLTPQSIVQRVREWEEAPLDQFSSTLGVYKNFEIDEVLGGMRRNSNGDIDHSEAIMTIFFVKNDARDSIAHKNAQGDYEDPRVLVWEADAVCILGFEEEHPYEDDGCPTPDVRYVGQFQRSFEDEFGAAVESDIFNIIFAFVLVIFYLNLNLGKRDSVWSAKMLSMVVLLIVGASYSMSSGAAAFCGVKANPLINNVPFLILGLGVDDGFVLTGEMTRHGLQQLQAGVVDIVSLTARSGGISVLVTSFTDALAFLIGSTTKLPALSAFCIYAGFAVIFCFLLMMLLFLPMLNLNYRRAKDNRFDCICCFKAHREHLLSEPEGCFPCCVRDQTRGCAVDPGDNFLRRCLDHAAKYIVATLPGRLITMLIFAIVFGVGVSGIAQLETDSELEWFFPDDGYVTEYLERNRQYFSKGYEFEIFFNQVPLHNYRSQLDRLASYISCQDFIQQNAVENWWVDFRSQYTGDVNTLSESQLYGAIYNFVRTGDGDRYWDDIQWVAADCTKTSCDSSQGIAHTRMRAALTLFETGLIRYNTMYTMRKDIKDMFAGGDEFVFPYNVQFTFWEEVGIIAEELTKNLIICGGVIILIICVLIPRPRVALVTVLNIVASVIEVVGFSHYWDLTINGVATIYFLICVGLAVDYSAHIGHTFNACPGKSLDRALQAVHQIGPSVFHAFVSTLLAIIVVAFSKSYVFQVFFKVLFLVSILSGLHGIWLLPVLLASVGGDKQEPEPLPKDKVMAEPQELGKKAEDADTTQNADAIPGA